MKWIIPISLLVIGEAFADIYTKKFSINNKWQIAVIALIFYSLANVFWLIAIKYGAGLARGGIIFSVACVLLALIIGLGVYKEHLSTAGWIGIIFGIISLALLLRE